MPTVVLFFSLAVLLSVVLALIVLLPWFRQTKLTQDDKLLALNIEVFKERLAELETDYKPPLTCQLTPVKSLPWNANCSILMNSKPLPRFAPIGKVA